MLYYGTVKVDAERNANVYKDTATGTFRYYVQGLRKTEWSEDFDTFVEAVEDAQFNWMNNPERDD